MGKRKVEKNIAKLEIVSIKPPRAGKQCFSKMMAKRLKRWHPFSIGSVPVHPSTLCENLVEIRQAVLKIKHPQTLKKMKKKQTQRKQCLPEKFFPGGNKYCVYIVVRVIHPEILDRRNEMKNKWSGILTHCQTLPSWLWCMVFPKFVIATARTWNIW